jgi:glycosyltransferase involved in cell wall biosynthesis
VHDETLGVERRARHARWPAATTIEDVLVSGPVVCLLPARNAAHYLPAWFESVGRFADVVVALDDGSTDETRAFLEAHPLVSRLLVNPRRESYAGWDDSANRNRLLAAASDLCPRWIMQLDADERMSGDDADALRRFLEDEADPSCAYLFRVFRMVDDLEHYDNERLWVGRLFAYEAGQCFPTERLHFVALPTSIPSSRWRRTTFRIQHLAGLTDERRRQRFEKYREVDAEHVFQRTYTHLLKPPGEVRQWYPRSPYLGALAHQPKPDAIEPVHEPLLSLVVVAQDDEAVIERSLAAILDQKCPDPFEVIVVTSGTDATADIVRSGFPDVRLVELDHPALPGEGRNVGLRIARGRYVSFPGSHVTVAPGSLTARVQAHRLGYAMVTGTMLNGTPTWAGWASYFLGNTTVLPGRPSQPLATPPVRCSYLRDALVEIGGFPEDMRAGEDTVVNNELFRRGYSAYRAREIVLVHHSPCRRPARLLAHHFERGRALGYLMFAEAVRAGRYPNRGIARFVLTSVPTSLRTIWQRVRKWGPELRRRLWMASPLVVAGALSAWAGACYELARRAPGNIRLRAPQYRPAAAARGGDAHDANDTSVVSR